VTAPGAPSPEPIDRLAALPALTPFVAPEALARRTGVAALLRLGANESAFGVAPAVLAAMRASLASIAWYGDPESADLRAALALRHGTTPDCLTVGAGIDDLLGLVVRAYGAGRPVVATAGTYPTFFYHLAGFGATPVTTPYAEDGAVPLDRLAQLARSADARLVYLANPDNPSGTFAARAEVERFAAALPAGALLILDEAYADFVESAELPRFDGDPRVVRMRTFSKAYGLAGARIAYAVANPAVVRTLDKIRLHFGVNRSAQAGALAALGERAFVRDVVAEVARGRAAYARLAAGLGLSTLASRTNFVCFDLGTRARAEATVEALLLRGVFVRKPGAPPIDRCIRVTVGTPAERERFAEELAGALAAGVEN